MQGLKGMLGIVAAVVTLPLMAQTADDPVVGTWKLNTTKAEIPAVLGIKGMTRVYTLTADGLQLIETQELTAGGTNTVTYRFRYDGKDSPVTGSRVYDSIAVKETSRGVTDSTLKLKGVLAGTNVRVIARDGKSMTMKAVLKVDGKDVPWNAQFDKQ